MSVLKEHEGHLEATLRLRLIPKRASTSLSFSHVQLFHENQLPKCTCRALGNSSSTTRSWFLSSWVHTYLLRKYTQAVCVCLCEPGPCFCALRLHGLRPREDHVRAVTNIPQLRTTEPAFGHSACASWLGWDSPSGRHSGTWLREQPPTQLLLFPVPRKQRTLQSFIQAIKCSSLRQTHQPISFPTCIKRTTVLRSLVRGAT